MVNVWQIGFDIVVTGSVYALIAVGYSLVYGVLGFINFAHGEVFMMGGMLGYFLMARADLPLPVGLLTTGLAMALLSVTIERFVYRPLRDVGSLALLIAAVGVSIVLRNGTALASGFDLRMYPVARTSYAIPVLGVHVLSFDLWILAAAVLSTASLVYLFRATWLGRAIRATAQDALAARAVGVSTDDTIRWVFALGGFLAGLAGFLVALDQGIEPHAGVVPGFKAFTACVIGGIGSLPGAFLGAFVLAFLEDVFAAYVSSQYRDAFVFAVLVGFLLLRPRGLVGIRVRSA